MERNIRIFIFILNRYNLKSDEKGWSFYWSFIEEKSVKVTNGFIIGFWTPSDSTGKYLNIYESDSLQQQWQSNAWRLHHDDKISIDSLNILFADYLKDEFGIRGYRRYKVCGKGERTFKEGWWWNIGFEGSCDEKFLKKFKDRYIKFWNPTAVGKEWDKVYIEITGNYEKRYIQ